MLPGGMLTVAIMLAVAAAYLGLAGAAVWRRNVPAAPQLAVTCALMFVYAINDALGSFTGSALWGGLAYTAAACLPIATLELVAAFVGRRRPLRLLRAAMAMPFVVLAVHTGMATVQGSTDPGSSSWATMFLIPLAAQIGVIAWLVAAHLRRAGSEERARTRLLVGALFFGVGGSALELAILAVGSSVRLLGLPQLLAAALAAAIVLRLRALEREEVTNAATVAVVAMVAVLLQAALAVWIGDRRGVLAMALAAVSVSLLVALYPMAKAWSARRARATELATLGLFSQQMAHDIRNPLAAIRGAAQFLQQEQAEGRSLDEHGAFLQLIVERTDHLEAIVAGYQRMGRVEPDVATVDLSALAREVVDGQRLALADGVELRLDEEPGLTVGVDGDLVTTAVENVIRNACEAVDAGGVVTVRVRGDDGTTRITVADDGPGMEPRIRERVLDPFFTTKAGGTGLGLPFARRVAEAHGGHLVLETSRDGTTVCLSFPRRPSRA